MRAAHPPIDAVHLDVVSSPVENGIPHVGEPEDASWYSVGVERSIVRQQRRPPVRQALHDREKGAVPHEYTLFEESKRQKDIHRSAGSLTNR